jgi:hypothetical protein
MSRRRTLLETNPYLKHPVAREAALIRTVESSTAIEGVFINLAKAQGDARKKRATARTAKGRKKRK